MKENTETKPDPKKCIANNGDDGRPEIPLWLCPCPVCTKMDWQSWGESAPTLKQFRIDNFPEVWG